MKKITLLALPFFCMSISAFAITVPPGTNNLQAVINSAAPGTTINLQAGTYYVSQGITVTKPLIIQGVGMTTIIQKTNGAAADVAAIVIAEGVNGATLRDFRLLGQDQGGPGIMVFGNNNTLLNVNVSDCGNNTANGPGSWRSGVLLDGAVNTTLTNVTSHHNSWVGISQHSSPETHITGADCFLNHGEGLTIDLGSDNCIVRNSLFNENNVSLRGVGGIGIDDVNGADIQFCTINGTKTLHGITFQNNVGGEDGCIIKNNTINNSAQNGIRVKNCQFTVTNTTISLNTFSGNGAANVVWECAQNTAALDNATKSVALVVYPNPASDYITLDFAATTAPVSFTMVSVTGQQVLYADTETLEAHSPIDVSSLSKGTYFYRVVHPQGNTTGKLIIK
jgi:hypothetical protein